MKKNIRNKKDIQKQIDQLKEIERLNTFSSNLSFLYEGKFNKVEFLKEQLASANLETTRKGFWLGFEDARCHPQENNILMQWEKTLVFNKTKQLEGKNNE